MLGLSLHHWQAAEELQSTAGPSRSTQLVEESHRHFEIEQTEHSSNLEPSASERVDTNIKKFSLMRLQFNSATARCHAGRGRTSIAACQVEESHRHFEIEHNAPPSDPQAKECLKS